MKPESRDRAPYPPLTSFLSRAIKMTSTPISWARTRAECERATENDARRRRRALVVDRVDDRRGTHAREHARSTTSARARIVESSPSARAISHSRGRANGTMAMRASVSARAAIATTTVRARRDARWTREKNAGGRGKRARGFGWDRRARSGARDAGEEGRQGVGIAARALLSTTPRGGARTGTGEGRARDDGEG